MLHNLYLAGVASVSVGFSARSSIFAFWLRENWGERNTDGKSGEGEVRREKETLARKPHDFEKRPFDSFAVG